MKKNHEKMAELFNVEELQERMEFGDWTPDSNSNDITQPQEYSDPQYNQWGGVVQ